LCPKALLLLPQIAANTWHPLRNRRCACFAESPSVNFLSCTNRATSTFAQNPIYIARHFLVPLQHRQCYRRFCHISPFQANRLLYPIFKDLKKITPVGDLLTLYLKSYSFLGCFFCSFRFVTFFQLYQCPKTMSTS